jgi:dihydroflavonol-4-reductase
MRCTADPNCGGIALERRGMAYARLVDAWSRVTGMEPDATPERATLVCGSLRVDSSKANRELDYIETPLETLLADRLAWMRQEG